MLPAASTARCRGQAVIEVILLAPLVTACVVGFAVTYGRVAATARAEVALQLAVAADAAGEPIAAALVGRGRLIEVADSTITVSVPAPLSPLELTGRRAGR